MALRIDNRDVVDVLLCGAEVNVLNFGGVEVWRRHVEPYLVPEVTGVVLDADGRGCVGVASNVQWTVDGIYHVELDVGSVWLTGGGVDVADVEIITTSYWEAR